MVPEPSAAGREQNLSRMINNNKAAFQTVWLTAAQRQTRPRVTSERHEEQNIQNLNKQLRNKSNCL